MGSEGDTQSDQAGFCSCPAPALSTLLLWECCPLPHSEAPPCTVLSLVGRGSSSRPSPPSPHIHTEQTPLQLLELTALPAVRFRTPHPWAPRANRCFLPSESLSALDSGCGRGRGQCKQAPGLATGHPHRVSPALPKCFLSPLPATGSALSPACAHPRSLLPFLRL